LDIQPRRCLFVLEVTDPARARRIVELVFLGVESRPEAMPEEREPGRRPEFVALRALRNGRMHPPLAGHLASVQDVRDTSGEASRGAAYLGNLWRPEHWAEGP